MATALFRPGDRPLLNLGLFLATLVTTTVTFFFYGFSTALPDAAAFALSVVAILGAHEMGHYVLARLHGVDTSLPYFLPVPLVGFGTLGAVIRIRSRIPTRNALVDIGAAGPLAGLAVAVPLLAWGIARSSVVEVGPAPVTLLGEASGWALGQEVLAWAARHLTGAAPAPEPSAALGGVQFSDSLLMLALQWLVLGPLPAGHELVAHPVVVAGWFGLLITMLNLLPVGQLDGGHLAYALLGRHARTLGKAVALGILALTLLVSVFWAVWLVLTAKLIGFGHPEVLRPEEPLGRGRKWVCALCLLALVGCMMPLPIRQVAL